MEQWTHHSALVRWCTYFQSDQRWRFHCHSILLHLSRVASCFVFMQKEFLIISRCSKLSACHSQGVTVAALFPVAFCFNDISTDLLCGFHPLWRGNTAFAQGQKVKGQGQHSTISDIASAVSWEGFITPLSQGRIGSSRWKVKIPRTATVYSASWTHDLN